MHIPLRHANLFGLVALILSVLLPTAALAADAPASKQPNILVIWGDDIG